MSPSVTETIHTNLYQSACLLLRVDDICSGKSAQQAGAGGGGDE